MSDPQAKRKAIYQKANEIMVTDANLIYVATDPRIWAFTKPVRLQIDRISRTRRRRR